MTAAASPHIAIGTVIAGKFRISRLLGSGGMAHVYEAVNVDIGKRVAVKLLAPELSGSKTVTQRFLREAKAAARIRSPFICDVFDAGTVEDCPFLVMELLEGETLYDLLAREHRLPVAQAFQLAHQVARGLQKAHEEGVVHRDLKPENIFLTTDGDGSRIAKIVDFGLAKFHEPNLEGGQQARLTRDGALFGTPAFMSPEQAEAKGNVGPQSDLWSLGCIVYEMLTGRTVWDVNQGVAMILAQIAGGALPVPSRVRKDLPPAFDAWFAKALTRNPLDRFGSAQDFARCLKEALGLNTLDSATNHAVPPTFAPPALPQPAGTRLSDIPPPPPPYARQAEAPTETDASVPPPAKPRRRWLWWTAGGVLTLAGGLTALLLLRPDLLHPSGRPDPSTNSSQLPPPVESADFTRALHAAQEQLAQSPQGALQKFEEAFALGNHKAARSLLSQASTAVESPGRCVVRAVGHPRAFSSSVKSSRPTLAVTPWGIVTAWIDNEEIAEKRQVYSTLLDTALRRVYPVISVSPELTAVRDAQLFPMPGKLGLLYWDGGVTTPGLYVRQLELDGKIAGAPQRLTGDKRSDYQAAITAAPDGSYWVVYSESLPTDVSDLYALHLGPSLEPLAPAIRVTAYAPSEGQKTAADQPAVAFSGGLLYIAYSLERFQNRSVLLLRANPESEQFQHGGVAPANAPIDGAAEEEDDRFLGQVLQLSVVGGATRPGSAMSVLPSIACSERGCFVTWDDQGGGAFVSFTQHNGEVLWTKEFDPTGSRPALGQFADELVIGWYKDKRINLAHLSTDGVTEPSLLGRVNSPNYEDPPTLFPGAETGQWYLAWRDYEAALHEPFVLNTQCSGVPQ